MERLWKDKSINDRVPERVEGMKCTNLSDHSRLSREKLLISCNYVHCLPGNELSVNISTIPFNGRWLTDWFYSQLLDLPFSWLEEPSPPLRRVEGELPCFRLGEEGLSASEEGGEG